MQMPPFVKQYKGNEHNLTWQYLNTIWDIPDSLSVFNCHSYSNESKSVYRSQPCRRSDWSYFPLYAASDICAGSQEPVWNEGSTTEAFMATGKADVHIMQWCEQFPGDNVLQEVVLSDRTLCDLSVELDEGVHTLTVILRETDAQLDWIEFEPVGGGG